MTTDDSDKSALFDLALELCRRAPADYLGKVCMSLKGLGAEASFDEVFTRIPSPVNSDLHYLLKNCIQLARHTMTWREIGWCLETAAHFHAKHLSSQSTEIVWTGPSASATPVRRIDQVLYDLVLNAEENILLLTFAAAKIERLKTVLVAASNRKVKIQLVLEFDEESEGQLSRSALEAFSGSIEHKAEIFYWPLEKRERNIHGRPGKLHAKCAIVDDAALISSANLTDDAFNRNIELGVLIQSGHIPNLIREHIQFLIQRGVLVPWGEKGV
jgi:cardiolipin synthase